VTPPVHDAVIFLPAEGAPGASAPFRTIAGLPLLERQLRSLGRHGVSTVHLAATPAAHAALRERIRIWQARPGLPCVELHAGPVLAEAPTPGPAILLDGSVLHHPDLLPRAVAAEGHFAYVDREGRPCGLGVGRLDAVHGIECLQTLPRVALPGGCFAVAVGGEAEAREAEALLYRSCIKATDGWFSRTIDRRVSLAITRRIIRLPLHPHVVTVFTLLVGVASGWCAARGDYFGLSIGGVLFLAASILDGVDGEIARAKLLQSKTGEWLDTVCDDLTNVVFILGLALGMSGRPFGTFWLTLGVVSLAVFAVTLAVMYRRLAGSGGQGTLLEFQEAVRRPGYRPGRVKAGLVALQPLIKRDFYGHAFMLCSVLDLPEVVLAGWTTGAVLTLAFVTSERNTLLPRRRAAGSEGG
jgi:phosphatidylglycerophosphate synthase